MPYIKQKERLSADYLAFEAELNNLQIPNPGHLNYLITLLIKSYLHEHGKNYQTCNDIVGALDNAKDEFKRRIQDPYEDSKIKENGDVY